MSQSLMEALQRHQSHLETLPAGGAKVVENASVGDMVVQGDQYFVLLDKMPKDCQRTKNMQVAEGDTQNSRHVMVNAEVYTCPPAELAAALRRVAKKSNVDFASEDFQLVAGPVVVVRDANAGAACEHPKHSFIYFKQAGIWATFGQLCYSLDGKPMRTRD